MRHRPTVIVITTGGTIAARIDPATGSVIPTLSGEELVQAVPGLANIARVEVDAFCNVLGPALSPAELFEIARRPERPLPGLRWMGSS